MQTLNGNDKWDRLVRLSHSQWDHGVLICFSHIMMRLSHRVVDGAMI
jgi:hypothetical protein